MSEVKRSDVPSMRSLIQGEQAVMGYEAVLASDYDALAAKLTMAEDAAAKGDAARQQCGGMEMEIEELRAELAELRARVVVVQDPVTMDGTTTIREYVANAVPKDTPMDKWTQGYEECKRRIHAMFEQPCNKRPNGLTVSEGLLRRLCEPLLSHADYVVARNELRALLSEQE
ncbi:hypothetical protein I5K50_10215 [Pseudomonas aeruginosa]|nr:hypothetical protein [Pseudomonas aeruginosa]MBH9228372.1 hypothetical protein [Pseudomonas aeruginosa]